MVPKNSLVLYKNRPGRVVRVDEKIYIELEGGGERKVREKDVVLLHPGPLTSLEGLTTERGEIATAWELLLEGGALDLAALAEFIYGAFTPATAWAAWEHLAEGLYFSGTPEEVRPRSPAEVAEEFQARETQAARSQAWNLFLERVEARTWQPEEDIDFLREIEDFAYLRRNDSRVLRELGRQERPEIAHALLLDLGYWDQTVNPYPVREGLALSPSSVDLPALPVAERTDLTHLDAFAIDDPDNQDPDDALSFHEGRVWVHVADAAALIPPGSPADIEARARGATLYLPEGVVPMLPEIAIQRLGLGLQDVSPALSFALHISAEGEIEELDIVPSWVRVQRTTYAEVETRLQEEPFRTLHHLASNFQARRAADGALFIDLPETIIQVRDRKVRIRLVEPLKSRDLVREAMLMAGEAAASYAIRNGLHFPYATQEIRVINESGEQIPPPEDGSSNLAEFFGIRRQMARGEARTQPAWHAGLGLRNYSRVTSPLRRYQDLVAHQQLRAYLAGDPGLDDQALVERVGASEVMTGAVSRAERLSRQHWTLVYLLQNPDWSGAGVLVDKRGARGRLLLPDLAFETQIQLRGDQALNQVFQLKLKGVDLPSLTAYFKILK